MAARLETIVNPFVSQDVTPIPFLPPGGVPNPPVRVSVGLKGGTKTFTTSYSFSRSTKIGAVHSETQTGSGAINSVLSNPSR